MGVKGLAMDLQVQVVDITESRLSLTLGEGGPLSSEALVSLVSDRSTGFRLTPEMRLLRAFGPGEQRHPVSAAKKVLRDLLHYAKKTSGNN